MFSVLIIATILLALLAYAPDVRAEGAGQSGPLFNGASSNGVVLGVKQNGVVPIGAPPAGQLDMGSLGVQLVMLPDGTTRHMAAP
jgi:hypothetical protein